MSSDWLKTFVHKVSFIFPLLLYFLLSMFILLPFKMIFHILRNKYLYFKDFCIAYHILLSTVLKYYLSHIEGHTEGDIFYLYIFRKVDGDKPL